MWHRAQAQTLCEGGMGKIIKTTDASHVLSNCVRTHLQTAPLTWVAALISLFCLYHFHRHPDFEKIYEQRICRFFQPSKFLPRPVLPPQTRRPPAQIVKTGQIPRVIHKFEQ